MTNDEIKAKIYGPKITPEEVLAKFAAMPNDERLAKIKVMKPDEQRSLYRLVARRDSKKSLWFLATELLGYSFLSPATHKPLARHFQNEEERYKMTLWPRETGKTTLGTVSESVFILLNNPEERILFLSDTEQMAEGMLSVTKNQFAINDKMRFVWPEFCPADPKDFGTKLGFSLPNKKSNTLEPSIMAAGRETNLTSRHFSRIFVDDLVNKANSRSKEMCDNIIDFYKSLTFLMSKDCHVYINGTIYSPYDLYCWIMKHQKGDYAIEKKSIISNEGVLLWPEGYNHKRIEEKKRKTSKYEFSCQMMNMPVSSEDAIFKIKDVLRIPKADIPKPYYIFTTVDPAISLKQSADFTAIVTAAVDKDFKLYILDIENKRMDPSYAIDAIIDIHSRFKPMKVGIEDVAYQRSLEHFLKKKCRELGILIPLTQIKRDSDESKFQRILALEPKVRWGEFYITDECRNAEELLDQMAFFSADYKGHDDILDAASDILRIGLKPTQQQLQKTLTMNDLDWWANNIRARNRGGEDTNIIGNEDLSIKKGWLVHAA